MRPVLLFFLPFIFLTGGCSSLNELQTLLGKISTDTQAPTTPAETVTPSEKATAPAAPAVTQTPPATNKPSAPVAPTVPSLTEQCAKLANFNVALKPGQKGGKVATLQQLLSSAGFYRNEVDGVYDAQTRSAVIAFHKALDQPRTPVWRSGDWHALCAYSASSLPPRQGQPDRVEIDLNRQVLYLIKRDKVMAIMPISSGNGQRYQEESGNWVKAITPAGDYSILRFYNGWRTSYLGELYRPWYFYNGYAVHGSPSVPPQPASHGCVRVSIWDADYLAHQLQVGMPLYIWKQTGKTDNT
ncbi:MAG: L,D-transpeptidase family protein [Candidatus Competibacteraceae bacterium]